MTRAVRPQTVPTAADASVERPAQPPTWLARTLDRLLEHARTLVPIDGAAYLVVDADRGWIEPAAQWFSSAELREAIADAHRRAYDRSRPGLVELSLERDRALLLPCVEAWEAAPELLAAASDALGDRRAAQVWAVYRQASVISCPVKTELGRTLGVLVVASLDAARPLGGAELRTVEVLADLSAVVLERAELLETEARRAREELQLKRASEAMSASLEPEDVYRQIAEQAARVTGARKALLTRVAPRSGELAVAAAFDSSNGFGAGGLSLGRGGLGEVARTRTPYVSRGFDPSSSDHGVIDPDGVGSVMHAPIELGPRLFGILSVIDQREDRFDEGDLELLVKLARSSAAAIANAIDFERERRIAQALTLGFVPESLPEVPGYEVGLVYAPASGEPTGGDLYGAWPLPGGDMGVLIGDVAGKGVETAALSAMVRFFIEARSWDAARPSDVLTQANAMLMSRLPPDTFVTAFFGILSPGRLRYCNAGHHLPLLLSGAGRPTPLRGHGLPLGIYEAPGYGESELELRPHDLVLAYTDGLIEARGSGDVYGVDRLTRFVAKQDGSLPLDRLVGAVHEDVASFSDGLTDDAVVLALRRRS